MVQNLSREQYGFVIWVVGNNSIPEEIRSLTTFLSWENLGTCLLLDPNAHVGSLCCSHRRVLLVEEFLGSYLSWGILDFDLFVQSNALNGGVIDMLRRFGVEVHISQPPTKTKKRSNANRKGFPDIELGKAMHSRALERNPSPMLLISSDSRLHTDVSHITSLAFEIILFHTKKAPKDLKDLATKRVLWFDGVSKLTEDLQYESLESVYRMKHFVPRESPWKIDSEGTGVSAKLRLLEEELLNLEKVCRPSDISKVPSLLKKQAKRYQALSGKIDDLCRRMQSSDPCDATLGPEFRTQRQNEFLLECFRLQQRASETGQKLVSLQTEITRSNQGDQLSQAKMNTGRSLDLIKNNLKEVQRNLEIWLARIIGDLEGILARDGASRVREFYVARYPFVQ
ncbi:unnamed protein product [Arabidopsis thaliana]|uniref:(thale cress) hypothetical protein n=1 Tax=Arabidopsis thaliana TaxID=3702 RepID=A0A7G2ENP4_ARATH|nr:unnamed protein product [Arabidopsis thaliana]